MNDSFAVAAGIEVEVDAARLLTGGGPLGIVFHQAAPTATQLGAVEASAEAELGLRELCLVPLRIGQHTLGVLCAANREGGFTPAQCEVVESTAEQVALALERYRFLAVVQRQASIDDLTGLYNHRFLVDYLAQQIALAERMETPLALLMLDLDLFKQLNDTYGHHAGDIALQAFARVLVQSVRRADLAARYGGEEFVVVMSNTSRDEAQLVAEKIRAAVARTVIDLGEQVGTVGLTVSIGGAAFPEDTVSARELITIADRALYAAKRSGRNRVAMADESIIDPQPPAGHDLRGTRREGDALVARHRPQE
jgi:diguanylate cyclase (GGDEF)-like protein